MKKFPKYIFVFLIIIALAAASVATFSAVTYYTYEGYTYRVVGRNEISLYRIENPEPQVVLPEALDGQTFVGIDSMAFMYNEVIEDFDMSGANGLRTISNYAFAYSPSLKSVSLPASLQSLGEYTFQGSEALETVVLESGITKIGVQTFNGCSSLTTVNIPETVTTIEKFAFGNCAALTSIEIPESVTEINPTAFSGDDNLTLKVHFNSYAHQYAKDNGLAYDFLDDYIKGDADMNGVVNVNDVTAIQRHVAEFELLNDLQLKAADVTRDGDVTVADATLLQRYLAEYADAVI